MPWAAAGPDRRRFLNSTSPHRDVIYLALPWAAISSAGVPIIIPIFNEHPLLPLSRSHSTACSLSASGTVPLVRCLHCQRDARTHPDSRGGGVGRKVHKVVGQTVKHRTNTSLPALASALSAYARSDVLIPACIPSLFPSRNKNGGGVLHGMHGHLTAAAANLGAIAESDEDEEDEGGEAVEKGTTEQVPQAFSHFTYEVTEGKKLVCDLQVS